MHEFRSCSWRQQQNQSWHDRIHEKYEKSNRRIGSMWTVKRTPWSSVRSPSMFRGWNFAHQRSSHPPISSLVKIKYFLGISTTCDPALHHSVHKSTSFILPYSSVDGIQKSTVRSIQLAIDLHGNHYQKEIQISLGNILSCAFAHIHS